MKLKTRLTCKDISHNSKKCYNTKFLYVVINYYLLRLYSYNVIIHIIYTKMLEDHKDSIKFKNFCKWIIKEKIYRSITKTFKTRLKISESETAKILFKLLLYYIYIVKGRIWSYNAIIWLNRKILQYP